MRKVVSSRSAAGATSRRQSMMNDLHGTLWAGWLETLEARRLLSASATPFKLTDPGPHVSASVRAAKPTGPTSITSAAVTALNTPQGFAGGLSGKIVYLNGGHGYASSGTTSTSVWQTGRGEVTDTSDTVHGSESTEMVEDFGNQDQLQFYADYILRAGGTVAALRPIGHQSNEVVMDNDSPGVTFNGGWTDTAATGGFYDEDYGAVADSVGFRFATMTSTETATAVYQPSIPSAGFYPVYTWAVSGTNRGDQLYRINHSGGVTEIRVDHRNVGKGWVYLGTYHFDAGSVAGQNVTVSSMGTPATGRVVIADAIRFGNGKGDINRGSGISGQDREDEAGLYWQLRALGQGTAASTIQQSTLDDDSNVGSAPRMAALMNSAPFGQSMFLSFHSNAGGGRGTMGLHNTTQGDDTPNQLQLANWLGREVNDDLVAASGGFELAWNNRGANQSNVTFETTFNYGEIRGTSLNNEMDGTILEVAFHDDWRDARLLRDPKVRDAVARATYQGTVRYFNVHGDDAGGTNAPLTFAPAAPTAPRAVSNAAGDVALTWTAPTPSSVNGDVATSYVVYSSRDGYSFDTFATTGSSTYFIPAANLDGGAYYFRIAAVNAGGESPASVVFGARKAGPAGPTGPNRVLIVNGFDRFDRTEDPRFTTDLNYDPPASGPPAGSLTGTTVDRVRPRFSNSFDYVVQAGEAIEAYAGNTLGFDSAQNEEVANGSIFLGNYKAVIWLSGEESTDNDTFNATEQSVVTTYLNNGGRLFVSGAEIGWDLDAQGGGASFYNDQLKADYVADDAGTYNITSSGVLAASIFAGLSNFAFDNGTLFYDSEFPDVLAVSGGSTVALNYSGGTGGAAATQFKNAGNKSAVVNFGFPFETITTAANRSAVMTRVLNFFELAASAAPAVPDLVAASDTGTSSTDNLTKLDNSAVGSKLQFTFPAGPAGATIRVYENTTLLGSAVADGVNPTVVTTNGTFDLVDGAHNITATQQDADKAESLVSGALAVTVDTIAPSTPPAPDLDSASDSGASNTDNLTNDTTPTLTGTFPAPPTAIPLTLYRDGVAVGNTNAGSTWSITSAALTDGTYAFTTTINDAAGNTSLQSGAVNVTIDTAAPTADIVDVTPDPRQTSVGSISIVFSEAVSGLDLSDLSLTRAGTGGNLLTGSESLTTSDNITFTLSGLAGLTSKSGTYTLAFGGASAGVVDLANNAFVSSASDSWVNDDPAPTVTDVFVSGTGWNANFLNYLATSGVGDATYGYRLDAAAHADELPWTNLNKISVRFSENVTLAAAAAFRVFGVATSEYAGSFTYDPATFTATWTLSGGVTFAAADKLLVSLDDALVSDANGNLLDGEWTNPTAPASGGADSYPSGDGTPGGDFAFRLNVLPGDVNRSGAVLQNDATLVRNAQGAVPDDALYTIFKDVNGSATILQNDATLIRNRQGSTLPDGEPAALP